LTAQTMKQIPQNTLTKLPMQPVMLNSMNSHAQSRKLQEMTSYCLRHGKPGLLKCIHYCVVKKRH